MRNFIFFASYYEAIKELPTEQQGAVYKAIVDYAMEGIEPSHLRGIQKSVFILIKPYIDSSKKKQESGAMGGKATSKHTSEQTSKTSSKVGSKNTSKTSSNNESKPQSNQIKENEEEKEYINILKKEINKEKNTILTDSELYSLIEGSFSDSEVCKKFKDYAEMRKAMGKNKAIRTKSTLDSCIQKLRKYAQTKEEALEILDYSIANCYQGLFDRFNHGKKSADKEAIPYAN